MISHRLYRQHITITNNGFVKDLSKVGRDLKYLIMVDNTAENFRLQSNNGLWIKTWTDDIKDTNLLDLETVLLELNTMKLDDVRPIIKKIKDEVNKRMNKNISNPYNQLKISSLLQ